MKYLAIWLPAGGNGSHDPTPEQFEKMGKLTVEMMQAGVLVDTGGRSPTGKTLRMTRSGSKTVVVDGPFTESKEMIGGYAVLNADSREALVAWTNRFLDCAGDGTSEIFELDEI